MHFISKKKKKSDLTLKGTDLHQHGVYIELFSDQYITAFYLVGK